MYVHPSYRTRVKMFYVTFRITTYLNQSDFFPYIHHPYILLTASNHTTSIFTISLTPIRSVMSNLFSNRQRFNPKEV